MHPRGPRHPETDARKDFPSELGIVTAVLTNPIWVVKTRMYTTSRTSPQAYTGVLSLSISSLPNSSKKIIDIRDESGENRWVVPIVPGRRTEGRFERDDSGSDRSLERCDPVYDV